MTKKISLDFSDLGAGREKKQGFLYRILAGHFDISLDDQPDFLIHGNWSQRHKLHQCTKIFWTPGACPPHASGSHFSLTCHPDSPTNLRIPPYSFLINPDRIIRKEGEADSVAAEERDFCCFLSHNGKPPSGPFTCLIDKLKAYRNLSVLNDAAGDMHCGTVGSLEARTPRLQAYKFCLVIDDPAIPGYTSGRLIEAMLARCIPVYYGNPDIADEFNPKSLINCRDFQSLESLLQHIKEVDSSSEHYRTYLKEPFFHNNSPNRYFSEERIVHFFERVFASPPPEPSRRPRWLGRWIPAKQDPPPKLEILEGKAGPVLIDYVDLGKNRPKENVFLHKILSKHFDVKICDNPDFVFYSHGGDAHRLHSGTRIYWTCEDYAPDWSVMDYALTCRHDDDPRHLRLPFYTTWISAEQIIKEPGEWKQLLKEKNKFCAFFTSYENRKTRHRFRFFDNLSRYRQVDSGGRARNNIGGPVPYSMKAKFDFLRPYKFYIAFENKVTPGYVTEKIAEAMAARCIPIYYGCPDVVKEFNPASFLNYHDFPNEEALIKRIREIDQNQDLYAEYLRQPFFIDNKPNIYYSEERLVDFFRKIFNSRQRPLALRKRNSVFGPWKLVQFNRAG